MNKTKSSFFGDVDAPDGGMELHDGGIHGVQGHTITVDPKLARWPWQRRVDGLQPHGKPGAGTFAPSDNDHAQVTVWMDALWETAGAGATRKFFQNIASGPPRWVWTIVLRRGTEVRMIEGGDVTWRDEPEPMKSALTWLRTKVDALCLE